MAIDLKVCGGYEVISEVENLVTLRTEVAVRMFVTSVDGQKTYHDGISILEVPE